MKLGNTLARFAVSTIVLCAVQQIPVTMENPRLSQVWMLPPFLKWQQHKSYSSARCDFCQSNMPWKPAEWMACSCASMTSTRHVAADTCALDLTAHIRSSQEEHPLDSCGQMWRKNTLKPLRKRLPIFLIELKEAHEPIKCNTYVDSARPAPTLSRTFGAGDFGGRTAAGRKRTF